ncbi:N-acetylglucosamine-specific PTS transporter subunit IIBC [Sphingomonas profundi]|uniref:N-acetylglucosamine-specific PTS transporter subunit IIBC n=1 Tax=Alterirhizorhabdus profundi TaxID=2681549 RepID=UPI0012E72627|nr:N-acetylglucosamine-specific PTS transporter subunit IIBC [Sphingomonas profundi]
MRFGLSPARLQPLGRALMLPIAVLPIAGLLLRLGQPDLLDIAFVAAAGSAIFGHLGLLFAIGVGVGLARENHGAAGLAGVVAYLVTVEGAKALLAVPAATGAGIGDAAVRDVVIAAWRTAQLERLSVPAGILSGLVAGMLYNRFSDIRVPDYLAFFGGRRFVPIAAGVAGLGMAALFGLGFPALTAGIDALSRWVVGAGPLGLFLYGALNRLLIVTGLHHILNNIAWFIIGDFHGATGDLKRFFAGDPAAGGFMSGFFPVMMFGLPAACLAMYRTALPDRRKAVGGMLLSLAATSFLTGVTEPIEFSFMFLAPALYALHAVLTGVAMVLMDALGVHLGFGFSAGLFDYALNFGLATRPLLLLPFGLAYAGLYYASFVWCIRRFDLKTPGREPEAGAAMGRPIGTGDRATGFVAALGGGANIVAVDACTTRLRLRLVDPARLDEPALRALGARGIVRPGGDAAQVVLGPIADTVAGEIRRVVSGTFPVNPDTGLIDLIVSSSPTEVLARSSRLLLHFDEPPRIDAVAFMAVGARGAVTDEGGSLHLILGPGADAVADAVRQRLAGGRQ